jgi:hypothetical protein
VNRWLKGILLVSTLLVSIGTSSCAANAQDSIQDTVTQFVVAYQGQQYSRCLDYVSQRLRDSSGDQALINRMQVARLFSGTAQLKSVGQPSISGSTGTVWVDMEGLLGMTNTVKLSLIREKGRWKIDGF